MKKQELRQIIKEEMSLFKNNGRLTPYTSVEKFNEKWNINEDKSDVKMVSKIYSDMEELHYQLAQDYASGDGSFSELKGTGKVLDTLINRILDDLGRLEKVVGKLQ